jgi:hypothetical protein
MGMFGVFAVAAVLSGSPSALNPQELPALPSQGLVISASRAVKLVDLRGRTLGRVDGFRFASETTFGAGLPRFVDAAGRFWQLDWKHRRFVTANTGQPLYGGATLSFISRTHTWVVRSRDARTLLRMPVRRDTNRMLFDVSEDRDVLTTRAHAFDLRTEGTVRLPPLCSVGSAKRPRWILLCGSRGYRSTGARTIEELVAGRRRVIAKPPGRRPAPNTPPVGHWAGVQLSPDGRSVLAQWSAECESPQAYLIDRRTRSMRRLGAVADESLGLGWTRDRSAVVYFPSGVCGGSYRLGPGVFAVGLGKPRLIVKATPRTKVAMWGL